MSFPKASNILNHELIGLKVEVLHDSNPSNQKIKGVIIDETMKTLVIKQDRAKRIAKRNAVFKLNLDGAAVKVEGRALMGRPEDRVKKKVKRRW
ncbi:MAG: ribonuclease P protein subunit [Candidatus Bathyarchaeota archaeon]|nr:ribonuclease P protein subunit [Candidatus Bathyarchaeota archaeon]